MLKVSEKASKRFQELVKGEVKSVLRLYVSGYG